MNIILSILSKFKKQSKYRGKTPEARARQDKNIDVAQRSRRAATKETPRDTMSFPELDKTRRSPLESSNIIEFSEQHLGISFEKRPCEKVILKCWDGLPLDGDEIKLYRKLTNNREEFEPGIKKSEAILCLGARSGKSFLASICALYAATRPEHRKNLNKGETGYVIIVATRQKQCEQIVQENVARMAEASSTLSKMIVSVFQDQLLLSNGIKILSAPCSSTASRGLAVIMLIEDELAYFMNEGRRADYQIYSSVRRGMAQFPHCRFMAISTPAGKQGLFWELFHEGFQVPGRLTCQAPTSLVNPLIPKKFLEKEERRDPDNYRREFEAEFAAPSEQFFPDELIERCCRLELNKGARPGVSYSCGIDQSGLSGRDFFSCALACSSGGMINIDYVRSWRTKDAKRILLELKTIVKSFRCVNGMIDQYAKNWIAPRLREIGLSVKIRPALPALYQNAKNKMLEGKVLMPDTLEVKEALRNTLGIWNASNTLSIKHDRSAEGHADIIDAIVTALHMVSEGPSGERIQVKVGKPFEHQSLLNPKNLIWGKDRAMPIPEKDYYSEEQMARQEGRRNPRIKIDPDFEED